VYPSSSRVLGKYRGVVWICRQGRREKSRKRVRVLRPCVSHFTHLWPSAPLQQLIPHLNVEAVLTLHDRIVTEDRKLRVFNGCPTARHQTHRVVRPSSLGNRSQHECHPGALTSTRHLGVWHPRALVTSCGDRLCSHTRGCLQAFHCSSTVHPSLCFLLRLVLVLILRSNRRLSPA
jgi:hypothetical protein